MTHFDEKREAILATLESMTYAQWSGAALIGTCESCKYWERGDAFKDGVIVDIEAGACEQGVNFGRGGIWDSLETDGCNLWERR